MNFTDFQFQRTQFRTERPGLLDVAETNLYRSLARIMPGPAPALSGTVHRCHLASQWVEFYGLPAEASRRAFVTSGVRDSLRILFRYLAGRKGVLWLPEDNYPVYHELAAAEGLRHGCFSTLPVIDWPKHLPADTMEHDWLLITNPLKPCGRSLDVTNGAQLKQWLADSPNRRVVLDTVYTLDLRFDAVTLDLLDTEQVIVLHSLTKGWLHPRCFGIALMPEQDVAGWMPVFRGSLPPQENLMTARHLMAHHADSPVKVAQSLASAQSRMFEAVRHIPLKHLQVEPTSYFVPVKRRWEDLLAENVLGLPASVFGSSREDFTILSTLNFAQ